MDFRWLFESSPWWFAALAIAATVAISVMYGNRLPAWTFTVLGAIRAGAAAKFKLGAVKLPKPPPLDTEPPPATWGDNVEQNTELDEPIRGG